MRDDIYSEVHKRILGEFRFKEKGAWLQEGKCPSCGKRELFARAEAPWVLRCGRANKCGAEYHVKELYPDIFDSWSNRYKATEENPNAAADAYLLHARGLDLAGLRGCYSQETYHDRERNITTATVRFPLPGGSWWERLIDQPGRFDKKARFAYGKTYAGQWWMAPDQGVPVLADASRVWICEGIFDALALRQAGEMAVSVMSTNNYPELALGDLRREIAAQSGKTGGPELIFAFDVGKAGVEFTRKYVRRAREEGWRASAAQVKPEGEGEKLDWNDLLGRDRLTGEYLDEYLWNGEVMIAPNATEKACLIYNRKAWSSFSFVHDSRTWWASFNEARIAEVMTKEGITKKAAARACADVTEIANVSFRTLYFQRDEATDESHYYLRVDFPVDRPRVKAPFSGAAIAAGAEFKKRLLSVAPGAMWTGTTLQLDRLIQQQTARIKTIQTIDFTGYSRDHEAWVLGEIAVHRGRVIDINDEDYFDLGKAQVKLRSAERMLDIDYDAERFDTSWLPVIWTAFGTNGMVSVAFWVMSFFAEQIRKAQKSLPFLEAVGDPGTGKSTLFEFLWKLAGRENYEGFDPQKATSAAIARNLGKIANLPVILLEGDRDEKAAHARRFEWEELKTAYNGRSVRSRGVKNSGNETYEPPFRGAIIIEQNDAVNASPAVLERILHIQFDKVGWSAATKAAAERLEQWPMEEISGFIVHMARREEKFLAAYHDAFARHEKAMTQAREINHVRIIKNHAQLLAALDAFASLVDFDPNALEATRRRIVDMAKERVTAISADHPTVAKFWELFDWLEANETDSTENRINRHRKPDELIAVSLPHFEERCRARGLTTPSADDLKKHLRSSKSRPFVTTDTVNGIGGHVHCWIFRRRTSSDRKAA